MAGESNKDKDTGKKLDSTTGKKDSGTTVKKKQKGFFSRIWNRLFRLHDDDFEKRLQHISKEEASVLARMNKRSQSWRRMTRNLILFSVIFEVIAVGYAVMTTRSVDLNWKMRASRILPMFLLPALSSLAYSGLVSFSRMCDRRDQKTLERLQAERQEKIDELKEKTNYYITQQLIQKYDSDPAAKAAAATVLASKLGADSGLKLYVEDEPNLHGPTGKSSDIEPAQCKGLRSRKQLHPKTVSAGNTVVEQTDERMLENSGITGPNSYLNNNQLVVGHHQPGLSTSGGGWIGRFAALLVGEDSTQSYALICGNCYMHNGLARKEDFSNITYYCPHCNALNKSQHSDSIPNSDLSNASASIAPTINKPIGSDSGTSNEGGSDSGTSNEGESSSSSPKTAVMETEGNETILAGDTKPVS